MTISERPTQISSDKTPLKVANWENLIDASVKHPGPVTFIEDLEVSINDPDRARLLLSTERMEQPLVFLLTGTSESGKSHFGSKLLEDRIASRIKILSFVANLQEEEGIGSEFRLQNGRPDSLSFLSSLAQGDPKLKFIVDRMTNFLSERDTPIATLETLKHASLGKAFQDATNIRALVMFIDAPAGERVSREATKTGRLRSETVRSIRKKDELKKQLGLAEVQRMADLTVCNSGTVDNYDRFVSMIGNQALLSTREFNGTPFQLQT